MECPKNCEYRQIVPLGEGLQAWIGEHTVVIEACQYADVSDIRYWPLDAGKKCPLREIRILRKMFADVQGKSSWIIKTGRDAIRRAAVKAIDGRK